MQPKTSLIIIAVFFIVLVIFWGAFLFIVNPRNNTPKNKISTVPVDKPEPASTSSVENLTAEQKIEKLDAETNVKVEKIINEGKTENEGLTTDSQQSLEEVLNAQMLEKKKILENK